MSGSDDKIPVFVESDYVASRKEWASFAEAIRALPEKQRLFFRKYYQGLTADTEKICGCAAGQLASSDAGVRYGDVVVLVMQRLSVRQDAVMALFDLNDAYAGPHALNSEADCAARYAHVLAECDRRAKEEP